MMQSQYDEHPKILKWSYFRNDCISHSVRSTRKGGESRSNSREGSSGDGGDGGERAHYKYSELREWKAK